MVVYSHPQEVAGQTEVCCEECGVIVATVDDRELLALETGKYGPVLCFGCDGQVDEVPPLLAGPYPYLLGLRKPQDSDAMNYRIIDPWRSLAAQKERLEWLQDAIKFYFGQLDGGEGCI